MSGVKCGDDKGEKSPSDIKQDIALVEESGVPGSDKTSTNGAGDTLISDEERDLVWKLDKRIMPILCLMYLFAFLDRSNLGNARLQGLPQDVLHGDPTGTLFDWINSASFFSYIPLPIPATIASKLVPSHIWLGIAATGWGVCSILMSTGFNFAGLMVARIGLGVFEACFGPGIPLYFSYFYSKHEMGLRMAYFETFGAMAGAFGGLVAFGIQNVHTSIANWRLLFIIEGIPTVAMGIIAFVFLPDRPERTKFLNGNERKIAIARMNRATSGDFGLTFNKSHIWVALKDWRVHTGGVIFFGVSCALVSISAFLPTIIKSFGFTNAIAQLMTAPPYAVAVILMTIISYASDRIQVRGLFIAAACIVGGVGYLILLIVHTNVHLRYFAVFCITSGTYTTLGLIIAWYPHNLGSETKRAIGIPMFMAIGQSGSILGSHIFPSTEGPEYIKGFANMVGIGVICALELLGAFLALVLSFSYYSENRRRNRLYGVPKPDAKVDTSELADKICALNYW